MGDKEMCVDGESWRTISITRIVASSEVVSSILFAGNELLGMEELAIGPGPDLIDHGGLQIDEYGPRHMLPRACLAKEGVERIVCYAHRSITAEINFKLNIKKKKAQ